MEDLIMAGSVFGIHSVSHVTIWYQIGNNSHKWDYTVSKDHPDFEYIQDGFSAEKIIVDNLRIDPDQIRIVELEWWRMDE